VAGRCSIVADNDRAPDRLLPIIPETQTWVAWEIPLDYDFLEPPDGETFVSVPIVISRIGQEFAYMESHGELGRRHVMQMIGEIDAQLGGREVAGQSERAKYLAGLKVAPYTCAAATIRVLKRITSPPWLFPVSRLSSNTIQKRMHKRPAPCCSVLRTCWDTRLSSGE